MERRVAVAGVVVLLLSAVVVVQILDPQFEERTPPDVDFSEPPNEVAADAAEQFEHVDYSYRIDIRKNGSADWRHLRTVRVDYTDREYYKTGPLGDRGVVLYGTDAITFVRPSENAKWRVTPIRDTLFPPRVISQPFLTHRLRNSNATVVAEDSTNITVRVDVHPLKIASHLPGKATLHISKQSLLIESVTVSYETRPSRTKYLRYSLTETGTDAYRPDDIHFSPREVFWDMLRGPIVNL